MSANADGLSDTLGTPPPASVATLPSEVLRRLTDQICAARTRQNDVMAQSVRVAVDGVPLPVRGIVRKALLG